VENHILQGMQLQGEVLKCSIARF